MKCELCTIDWTAVSAIASFIMIFITAIALKLNNSQLNELKRQWKDQNKITLSCTLIRSDSDLFLRVINCSRITADNVSVSIKNKSKTESTNLFKSTQDVLKDMKFVIPPNGHKDIHLYMPCYPNGKYDGFFSVDMQNNNIEFGTFNLYLKEINIVPPPMK